MECAQAVVTIVDTNQGKILTLDPSSKIAMLQEWNLDGEQKRSMRDRAGSQVEHLRAMAGKEGKPVGERRIGQVEAQGFHVETDGLTWTVWVDADRKMPLVMETTIHVQDQDFPSTMSDFQIDPKLDDSLFRLEPPQGYTIKKIDTPIAANGEQALMNLFRLYAESSGGAFPPTPLDRDAFRRQFPPEKFKDPTDSVPIRVGQSLAGSLVFLEFELKKNYGYKADGVKLGDAAKVLFWYRKQGAEKYRAIYGDLHADEVTADRLPKSRSSEAVSRPASASTPPPRPAPAGRGGVDADSRLLRDAPTKFPLAPRPRGEGARRAGEGSA